MPKAGSSSIQNWLRNESSALRAAGITIAVARRNSAGTIRFRPHFNGGVNSGWIVERMREDREGAAERFVAGLAEAVESHKRIVVSSEAFAHPFWQGDPELLPRLSDLATQRPVRVAYYARPQHLALEAAWRQWGFRSGLRPADYIQRRAEHLDYAATAKIVERLAPRVEFGICPCRADLLDSGSVVVDFAGRFLDFPAQDPEEWINLGLPLEVANLLRRAPKGMFWADAHDNRSMGRIKAIAARAKPAEAERIALSRRVLQRYAFEQFGEGNRSLGWPEFVPWVDEGVPGIDALDDLWAPQADEGELAFLFCSLQAAMH
jgi:hypothetical protein